MGTNWCVGPPDEHHEDDDRPARIVFDAMGAVGTVRLDADAGTTNMTVTIRCTAEGRRRRWSAMCHGVPRGTG